MLSGDECYGDDITSGPSTVPYIVFRCSECGAEWTDDDDPDEWAYGHDCES